MERRRRKQGPRYVARLTPGMVGALVHASRVSVRAERHIDSGYNGPDSPAWDRWSHVTTRRAC